MVAKRDESVVEVENAALKAQMDAQAARMDQLLDVLTDQQEQLAKMSRATPTDATEPVGKSAAELALDREWEALREEFKDLPQIDVFHRQVEHGTEADAGVRLRDEPHAATDPTGKRRKWALRWVNFGKEGRSSDPKLKRYEKVRWDELADMESMLASGSKHDDFVRRGDRGHEVLHKIPAALLAHMKKREAMASQGLLQSASGLRDHLANGTAKMAGKAGANADMAGSLVSSGRFTVDITPGATERFTP